MPWFRKRKETSLQELSKLLYPSHGYDEVGRFSSLLLEHGETPVDSWAVVVHSEALDSPTSQVSDPPIHWEQRQPKKSRQPLPRRTSDYRLSNIAARLHLCTKSLVIEPTELSRGLVRLPFAKMSSVPTRMESTILCTVDKYIVLKEHNVIGPFQTILAPTRFRLDFEHSEPTRFLEECQSLYASKTVTPRRPQPIEDPLVPAVVALPCHWLRPLQSHPGTCVVTSDRLVLHLAGQPPRMYSLHNLAATARRYHGLRDCAIELYYDKTSVLIACEGRHDRERLYHALPTVPCWTDRATVVQASQAWHKGELTNFEYLMVLNSAAGRSFHDLSRYPVMPWVIADYTSETLDLTKESTFRDLTKPMGAMNPERLEYFLQRYQSMQEMEEPFLYGTHYSAPGYVLYFLVRRMPEHMLCLQNGKFDAPDRMFHSVAHCYNCALTNHADVKEVVPEFYQDIDFLWNARGLSLGATQNGDRVNDVTLPPWARSARDFVAKNKKALESDYCTQHLPRWIDLIFGCKSRGEAAMKAYNLFHPITYLGPRELAGMQTEQERFTAELQATEFGIVQDQILEEPHVLRSEDWKDVVTKDLGRGSSKDDGGKEAWELLESPSKDRASSEFDAGASLGQDSVSVPAAPSMPISNPSGSSDGFATKEIPLSGIGEVRMANDSRSLNQTGSFSSPTVVIGSSAQNLSPSSPGREISPAEMNPPEASNWDMKVLERKRVHNDTVSGCVLVLDSETPSKSIVASTSLDGGLLVHTVNLDSQTDEEEENRGFSSALSRFSYSTILNRGQASQSTQSKLTEYRSHSTRDPLACLALAHDGRGGHVAFAGGHDDVVLAYGINSACAVASVYSHRDAVTGLDLIERTPLDSESAIWQENSTHIMISGSWDATVKVWSATVAAGETVSISREPRTCLFQVRHASISIILT